jgi:TRAP-type C4-dicarboxylate transport system permease large subunit
MACHGAVPMPKHGYTRDSPATLRMVNAIAAGGTLRTPFRERVQLLSGLWGVIVLFLVVMGGIYLGIFTPSESAGIGAAGAFVIALARRGLRLQVLFEVLVESAGISAVMVTLLIGALMFANFINVAGFSGALEEFTLGLHAPPIVVVWAIIAIYVVLGGFLESLSMILLTVPIFFPIVKGLGFDPIWFGIILVVVTEISLITPPVALNIFVLHKRAARRVDGDDRPRRALVRSRPRGEAEQPYTRRQQESGRRAVPPTRRTR